MSRMEAPSVTPATPTKFGVIGSAVGLLTATSVVALVDPHASGRYPTCPLLALTGLYCPFCGGLRAVHDVANLDLVGAMERNPVVVLGLPVVAVAWLLWAQRAFTGRRLVVPPAVLGPAVIVLLVVFGVLRNVPGWTWLSPA